MERQVTTKCGKTGMGVQGKGRAGRETDWEVRRKHGGGGGGRWCFLAKLEQASSWLGLSTGRSAARHSPPRLDQR
ncbi:hypothetical protein NEUTE2DRAFT_61162 [Neurospora tetrasperma FGSC 2509]|nr:hypothetical protein NEUTE2DRAFT_61162 [Neurospora tetrasperma FGSC 2509]